MQRLSKGKRAYGYIKAAPDDFIVEEITKSGVTLERDRRYFREELAEPEAPGSSEPRFSVFVMQKRDWNTAQALREVAKRCGRGIKSAGFAGSKDRTSVSTQLCSMFGAKPERLLSIHIKDISINGAWESATGIGLGDLLGNRFCIKVSDGSSLERISEINAELGGIFPNYYGEQRFGARNNNAAVGLCIIKGDFEGAVRSLLMDFTGERSEEAIYARKRLAEEMDFRDALEYFPKYLKSERMVLASLAENPSDYAKAIRRLPRAITLMFVHSVESEIFNKALEARMRDGQIQPRAGELACASGTMGFPCISKSFVSTGLHEAGQFALGNIVGYNSENLSEEETALLEGLGITKEDFKVKHMPELNCKGTTRPLFAPYVSFAFSGETVSFSLPAGSYATVLINELLEITEPKGEQSRQSTGDSANAL